MLNRKYLELIRFKVYADLKAETTRTYLGILWWILDPIIFMAIFYVVFGVLLQRGTENFVAFLLVGLVFWRWFQNSVSAGSNAIQGGRALMRQVHLPKLIFPLVSVFTDFVKFLLTLILLLLFLRISGFGIGVAYWALPVVMAGEFLLIVGVTAFVAAIVPPIPDIKHIVRHTLQMGFFLSGIFYSVEFIPEQYQNLFYLNPMAVVLTACRDILMENQWPEWASLGYVYLIGLIFCVLGTITLRRLEFEYPKMAS